MVEATETSSTPSSPVTRVKRLRCERSTPSNAPALSPAAKTAPSSRTAKVVCPEITICRTRRDGDASVGASVEASVEASVVRRVDEGGVGERGVASTEVPVVARAAEREGDADESELTVVAHADGSP